ncbi:prepilin peptidase [Candidatus Nitrosotenuis chungbukensis]|uniref:prepilin peptidase n=1 Tax=Candidatus Nitrosotenuis chungbukensis TaxID=1353246 RepID=UPI0005B29D6E|nr:prepilin peptidase [Candidatus Nitrosotenuis chungbukensis]WKT57227.1 prepilin peptidase [Candidatus Nitrosotenuis chungbukensis]
MNEFEIIRVAITIGMMSVATYWDVKTRYVDDRVWVFGLGSFIAISAVFIFVFETSIQELIGPLNIIGMMSGIGIAFAGWIMKFNGIGYATGDFFGLLSLSVILPKFDGVVIPILTIMFASVLCVMITVILNLKINIKSKNFFSEFDEPAYKKILAYFTIHKKMENENFTFPAEITVNGKRKFQFRHDPDTQEFSSDAKETYVCTTTPMMPYILAGLGCAITAALVL